MGKFYVNKNVQIGHGNNHEVHRESCFYLPKPENRIYLGDFLSSSSALAKAKEYYPYSADGCVHCCPEIHKR